MKGLVFDIKHFSVHDGPGIRTTIFLKGCPLRCVWCHNPEGLDSERKVVFRKSRCQNYENCLQLAPDNLIKVDSSQIKIINQNFKDWDKVIDSCPSNAIEYDSKYYTVAELMRIIRKDKPFFREEGGVTISGGDPIHQYDFLLALLKACKAENINTCIETSGFIDEKRFGYLLNYLDNIYMDFKLADDYDHFEYTGVHNDMIKNNLRVLLNSDLKDRSVIRLPLVPGITASKENIEAIARYLSEIYPGATLELLNFNPLSLPKYEIAGKKYYFEENPSRFSLDEMKVFKTYAEKHLNNVI